MSPHSGAQPAWHILQISGPLDVEFASAMAELAPVIGWQPQRTFAPGRFNPLRSADSFNGNFTTRSFPLLPGYARPPLSFIARTGPTVTRVLRAQAHTPHDILVCTAPYFAPVAERWPGPVVYWLTDSIRHYPSSKGIDVESLDERMCRVATLLCPNSARLRSYLLARGADMCKILVVPNATRATNIYAQPPTAPAPLPEPARHLRRPVAGVIGNLAGNLDWVLLDEATARTPTIQWLFVGPTDMAISDPRHRAARARVMSRSNTLFVGRQPYGDLAHYARGFDVAILPYLKCEPTFSGSSTRFYEHLAACRPMLATRAFEELLHKEPYLSLIDGAQGLIEALHRLELQRYDDGLLSLRWQASRTGTWQARTTAVYQRLAQQLGTVPQFEKSTSSRRPAESAVPA